MAEPIRTPRKPPDKPEPEMCCNRGCCPCIFDYYYDALDRWKDATREAGFDPEALLREQGVT